MLAEAVPRFGAELIACVHVNDRSTRGGARRDRHANLGEGEMEGGAGASRLGAPAARPRAGRGAAIVETPDDDDLGHARDLALLRSLLAELECGC